MKKENKKQDYEIQEWLINNMIHDLQSLKADLCDNDLRAKAGMRKSTGVVHLKDKIELVQKTLKQLEVA